MLVAMCLIDRGAAAAEPFTGPLLIEGAAIHRTQIAFACGGRIWLVAKEGGLAQAVTRGSAHDSLPCFSPDGSQLAFLRRGQRAMDVYLYVLATGNEQRLTHHPGSDFPVGWTPDAKRVLFNSGREGFERLFTIGVDESLPTALPLPVGYTGCFSPDGKQLAYLPRSHSYHTSEFPYYRGGKCSPLWILDLDSTAVEQVTNGTTNVRDPMWIGQRIYYLWDRDGRFELFVYDTGTKEIHGLTSLGDFGARTAATDGESVLLAGDGGLQVYDLQSKSARSIQVAIPTDDDAQRPRIVNALRQVQSFSLGHDGEQAVVCARGDVFLVDTTSGQARNLTNSSGVFEREARLSPDGRQLAYFCDSSGEYELHVRRLETQTVNALSIEPRPSVYRELTWSPDGKFIAFSDKRLSIWVADLAAGTVKMLDSSSSSAQDLFHPNWSPDGRYLAYAKYGDNRLPRIYVHEIREDRGQAATPEDCYATCPVFDKCGRYLYFLSSPNAPASDFGWSVLAGVLAQPLVVRNLNAIVLRTGDPAPVSGAAPNLSVRWKESQPSTIDIDGIESRIVPIGMAPHGPIQIMAGEEGVLHLVVEKWPEMPGSAEAPTRSLFRLDLRAPAEINQVVPLVNTCVVSYDGKAILCPFGSDWRIATWRGAKATVRPVSLAALPAPVDPSREWRQISHEAWRIMRDFFYDPAHHGLDWGEVERRYAEFLPGVRSREQLNVLLRRMLGHVSVSHLGVGGGEIPPGLNEAERIGLLGADLEVADGLYRVRRVLRSGHFDTRDPLVRSPLSEPGSEVGQGDYLFAIDDEPLDATKNIYAAMRCKASQSVQLLVGKSPDRVGARTVRIVPLADESMLRLVDWAAGNQDTVRELSQGKLGYFFVPSYMPADVRAFFRGYFANRSKPGFIIDQRFNGGGNTPDSLVELLARRPMYYYLFREGDDLAVPVDGRASGPTVLLINEENGSAAETFAMMFQLKGLGPLVGHRTGGGGIGPYGWVPELVDGGRVRIPSRAAYDPSGSWGIENQGVRPDVAVDILPQDWLAGRDPQLEAAVRVGLEALASQPITSPRRPQFPVHP